MFASLRMPNPLRPLQFRMTYRESCSFPSVVNGLRGGCVQCSTPLETSTYLPDRHAPKWEGYGWFCMWLLPEVASTWKRHVLVERKRENWNQTVTANSIYCFCLFATCGKVFSISCNFFFFKHTNCIICSAKMLEVLLVAGETWIKIIPPSQTFWLCTPM